jgi:hypothetical protein
MGHGVSLTRPSIANLELLCNTHHIDAETTPFPKSHDQSPTLKEHKKKKKAFTGSATGRKGPQPQNFPLHRCPFLPETV